MERSQGPRDSGLAALVTVLRLYQLPADPIQLQHQFAAPGRPMRVQDLLRACKRLGLRARQAELSPENLNPRLLPLIGIDRAGDFFVIAKAASEPTGAVRLLMLDADGRPATLTTEELGQRWNGSAILLVRRNGLSAALDTFDLRWFIPSLLRYRRLFGEVLLISFFLQLFALVTPLFFQVVMDKVLVHRGFTTLDVLAFGFLVIALFDAVLGGLRSWLFAHTTHRVDVELGAKLFNHLISLPLAYFEARQAGHSVARVRELDSIRNFITGTALTLVIDLGFTVIFFAVMWFYSPTLTWIVLGTLPVYILLSLFITPILRHRLDEKFRTGAENQAFLVEAVTGVETLKSMAVEPQMQRRWEEQLAQYVTASFRSNNLNNIANQIAGFTSKLTTLLIVWWGAHLVIDGVLTVGQLVAFNMIAGRVSGPILKLVQLWQDFQQAGISIRRLGDILNTPTEPGYNPNRSTLPRVQGRVRFEHVGFRYRPDGPRVLSDIVLDIGPGETVGIVGRSGSGKSTLAKLLQRLHVPESGRVLVDGVDLAMVDTAWLRRHVGVVPQESFLFSRSVRENIALIDPGLPMAAVVRAARMAGAHDFILEMPQGYDSPVGEHGCNLSGGQRQRIAIARALIGDPRILIFDEATSALDYESERVIQQNMSDIARGRTLFVIAHRLGSVRHCDRILVMDRGRVVESGSHEQLLERRGLYHRLYGCQRDGIAETAVESRAPG